MTIDKKYFLQNSIFIGNRKNLEDQIEKEVQKFFEDPFGQDKKVLFYKISELQIKINKIREIKNWSNKSFDGVKVIIISSFIWSEEVQNALLKLLEDTPKDTYIYLISQNKYSFLSTLLSRVFVCKFESFDAYLKMTKEVLSLDINERLDNKNVKKILSAKVKSNTEDDEDDTIRKDLEMQLEFFEAIVSILKVEYREKKVDVKTINKIQEIENIIKTEGISTHYFIEFALLSIPKLY
jgi:DNA polymerase III delta prime subunit